LSLGILSWKQVGCLLDALRDPRFCHDQNNEHCLFYLQFSIWFYVLFSYFHSKVQPFSCIIIITPHTKEDGEICSKIVCTQNKRLHDVCTISTRHFYISFSPCSVSQSRSRGVREPPFFVMRLRFHLMTYCNDSRKSGFVAVLSVSAWNAVRDGTERPSKERESMLPNTALAHRANGGVYL